MNAKHLLRKGTAMGEVKKCPKCGGELEKGVMQASYVVFWNEDDVEEHWTAMTVLGRTIMLESQTWRCKNCQLAIFYYKKENLVKE
jgi:uncharacterized protein with PIN domain